MANSSNSDPLKSAMHGSAEAACIAGLAALGQTSAVANTVIVVGATAAGPITLSMVGVAATAGAAYAGVSLTRRVLKGTCAVLTDASEPGTQGNGGIQKA